MSGATGPSEPQGAIDERRAALVGQILRGELTPQRACEIARVSELELKRWVRAYTRAGRRAIDDRLEAALAVHGLELGARPSPELTGDLGSVGLPELIQTIQYGRKDAHIRIDHDGQQSELWCADGDVVDASSARLTGSAAVYRILAIERGQLHADFSPVQRGRTIHASTQALMLEAAKRADECAEIRSRLGDTLNIYVPSASSPSDADIEPDQGALLRAFDGTRSIDDVVHQSELPDLETLGLIARLLEQEWLVPKPFKPAQSIERVQRLVPRQTQAVTPSVDASFRPLAASLRSRLSWHGPRHRLWGSALAGVAVVSSAFAVGFYSARVEAPAVNAASQPACGSNQAALPGGVCIDRAEVSAGDYQVCVHAGACEPVQRELDLALPGAAAPTAGRSDSSASEGTGPEGGGPEGGVQPSGAASNVTVPASVPPAPTAAAPGAEGGAPSGSPPDARVPASLISPALAARNELTAHCNSDRPGRESLGRNCVTFQQARRYCEWRGGRVPLRSEWEFAALPENAGLGIADLNGGLLEWTIEPATGVTEASRERAVVLGGGLATGAGTGSAGTLTRLYMNANAQGRSVGFRCVLGADAQAASLASNREPTPP